ncbi:MAG TPA: hypothetical protein V6D50_06770 [Chroococcales cyanobacterium]
MQRPYPKATLHLLGVPVWDGERLPQFELILAGDSSFLQLSFQSVNANTQSCKVFCDREYNPRTQELGKLHPSR